MRILLVVPTHLCKFKFPAFVSITDFPVGLAYVAAALQAAGHEVRGVNPNNRPDFPDAKTMVRAMLADALAEVKPDLVCTGGLCTDYAFIKDALRIIRNVAPKVPVLLGGGIVTYDPEFIFDSLRPDFAVIGEAEGAVVKLVQTLAAGRGDVSDVPNIMYWDGSTRKSTRLDFNYGDLEQLPFPNYDIFGVQEMLEKFPLATRYLYRYPRSNPRPMVLVSGRSCPFSCTFCVHDRPIKYRARSLANVMTELTHLHKKYQFNVLVILDELFALKRDRLREFSEAVLKGRETVGWDFHWTFQTHASAAFDQETLLLAKKAGCYFFSYGMESASPTVLKSMNKRSTPAQVAQGIAVARETRVGFGGNFIFGDPAETSETVTETLQFFRKHCGGIHMAIGSIQPYPGSRLFQQCLERGLIKDKLSFYERIDECRYNMTGLPEKPWLVWLGFIGFLGGLGLWLKPTKALHWQRRPDAHLDVFELHAQCPCCGNNFTYTHAMPREQKQSWALAAPRDRLASTILKFKKHPLFVPALLMLTSLWAVRRPWFGLLRYFKGSGLASRNSFVTGCPTCNQCLRVEWDKHGETVASAQAAVPYHLSETKSGA